MQVNLKKDLSKLKLKKYNDFKKKLMEKSNLFLQKYMKNHGHASESVVEVLSKNI